MKIQLGDQYDVMNQKEGIIEYRYDVCGKRGRGEESWEEGEGRGGRGEERGEGLMNLKPETRYKYPKDLYRRSLSHPRAHAGEVYSGPRRLSFTLHTFPALKQMPMVETTSPCTSLKPLFSFFSIRFIPSPYD